MPKDSPDGSYLTRTLTVIGIKCSAESEMFALMWLTLLYVLVGLYGCILRNEMGGD